ncbi:MAG: DsbA family protein [Alphaproteobacteria bacterium]|nr:DsbA family protein [Alphaproteobacteria bacterium]
MNRPENPAGPSGGGRGAVWRVAIAAAALLAAMAIPAAGRAQTPAAAGDRDAVREIVREYLLERPEIIEEALGALRARREAYEQARIATAIREHDAAIRFHPMSPVSGNLEGDVTMVEFLDYQCGYCKRSLQPVKDLLAADDGLRVVWKEFPILGPVSRFAARAAMAAARQGLYLEYHLAVMGSRGQLTEDRVIELAGGAGLDLGRLRSDMEDPAIEAYLDETATLARTLGIGGTPAFVIGETLVPGAAGGERLRELIARVRSGG